MQSWPSSKILLVLVSLGREDQNQEIDLITGNDQHQEPDHEDQDPTLEHGIKDQDPEEGFRERISIMIEILMREKDQEIMIMLQGPLWTVKE